MLEYFNTVIGQDPPKTRRIKIWVRKGAKGIIKALKVFGVSIKIAEVQTDTYIYMHASKIIIIILLI